MVAGSSARWTMLALMRSLSAKRSMAVPRLASAIRGVGLPSRTATAASPPWFTRASATSSETSARPAIASCFCARTVLDDLDQVGIGEHRRGREDRQRDRLHVVGEPQCHIVRQLPRAAQAGRQCAPHLEFDILRQRQNNVVSDPQLGLGQLCSVELTGKLVRHLGANRSRRLRKQTRHVGEREG